METSNFKQPGTRRLCILPDAMHISLSIHFFYLFFWKKKGRIGKERYYLKRARESLKQRMLHHSIFKWNTQCCVSRQPFLTSCVGSQVSSSFDIFGNYHFVYIFLWKKTSLEFYKELKPQSNDTFNLLFIVFNFI